MNMSRKPKPWEIWIADIRFTEKPSVGKHRPVLILEREGESVGLLIITGQYPPSKYTGIQLIDWEHEGLKKPSFVCCWPRLEVPLDRIFGDGPIGKVTKRDRTLVEDVLSETGA